MVGGLGTSTQCFLRYNARKGIVRLTVFLKIMDAFITYGVQLIRMARYWIFWSRAAGTRKRQRNASSQQDMRSVFSGSSESFPHTSVGRHLYRASGYKLVMKSRFAIWDEAVCY